MFIVRPPGIVYEGETVEQSAEKDRLIADHNRKFQEIIDRGERLNDKEAQYREWYRNKFGMEYE